LRNFNFVASQVVESVLPFFGACHSVASYVSEWKETDVSFKHLMWQNHLLGASAKVLQSVWVHHRW
jgi:hypothetical protein